jgi:hypothetical protein
VDWARFHRRPTSRLPESLFLHSSSDTWTGSTPFYELLWGLGATVEHSVEGYNDGTEAAVNLACTAPSEAQARQIADQLRTTVREGEINKPALRLPDQEEEFRGEVQHEANKLKFTYIPYTTYADLYDAFAYEKLPELVSYLEAQGCRDFEFDVTTTELE